MTEPARLVMVGDPGAAVCEDDSCLLPGAAAPDEPSHEARPDQPARRRVDVRGAGT